MTKSLLLCLAASFAAVACSHDDNTSPPPPDSREVVWVNAIPDTKPGDTADLGNLSNGASTYSFACAGSIDPFLKFGETEVKGGFRSLSGTWELESLRSYTGSDTHDGSPSGIEGQYANGRSEVLCHTSVGTSTTHSSVNSNMNVPYVVDADHAQILAKASLLLQARNGNVGARLYLANTVESLPNTDGAKPPLNVQAIMVKTADGKVAVRFIMDLSKPPFEIHKMGAIAVYHQK